MESRRFQASKATIAVSDPDEFEDHVFATIDRVIEKVGSEYSVHGEVRSPFDHLLNITGMEDGIASVCFGTGMANNRHFAGLAAPG